MPDAEVPLSPQAPQPPEEVDQRDKQILDNVVKIMETPRMKEIIENVVANSTPPPAQPVKSLGGDIDGNAPPDTVSSVPGGLPAADNNNTPPPVKEKYDIDGVPGTEKEKHIYTNLGEVNAARIKNDSDPLSELSELKSGGRRRTKHKKHHKKGGKKSHKKGKSSKKVAKRRKSRKTGGRRSRKQNKH